MVRIADEVVETVLEEGVDGKSCARNSNFTGVKLAYVGIAESRAE